MTFRPYDPADDAIREVHRWAMREAGVDPDDVPGTDDLRSVRSSYLDPGGAFVVGVADSLPGEGSDAAATPRAFDASVREDLATHDGAVVAMGGYLPNGAGHTDERDRPGSAELHRMRVAPPCQRRGFGRTLIAELERRAAAAEFGSLLATMSTRQSAALSFYPDNGYEEVGRSAAGAYELVHYEKSC